MKKLLAVGLLLVLVFSFAACGKGVVETELQTALKDYSQLVEQELPDDLCLKLYYLDPGILTRAPLTVDGLINFPDVNEIVIDSDRLKAHADLLRQISADCLVPVAEPSGLHARLCYVFETERDGDVLVIAFCGADGGVFVNDVEVAFDDIFRDVVKPFVSEEVMEDLEYLYSGNIKPSYPITVTGIPEDFSFSLVYGVAGDLTYDSETGELVKQRTATNVEDYTTTFFFTDEQKEEIYDLFVAMDPASYPDEYNPFDESVCSDPSYEIILTVTYNGVTKMITCHDVAIAFDMPPKDVQSEKFRNVLNAITKILYASDEWQALPEYEHFYI